MDQKLSDILFKPELKSLAGGKRLSTLLFLTLIYTLALFSLGSGLSIYNFLEKKMRDPFVEMVSTVIPNTDCTLRTIKSSIVSNDNLKAEYGIVDIRLMTQKYCLIDGGNKSQSLKAGAFNDAEHLLWSMLVKDTTLFLTPKSECDPFHPFNQSGVILSESAAASLELDFTAQLEGELRVTGFGQDKAQRPIELPVLGVVRQLPLGLDILLNEQTLGFLVSGAKEATFDKMRFVPNDQLNQIPGGTKLPQSSVVPGGRLYPWESMYPGMELIKKLSIATQKLSLKENEDYALKHLTPEYLLFRFEAESLDKVRALNDHLRQNKEAYGCPATKDRALKIDLTDIESKEILRLFLNFARILSTALILLSVVLIVNYTGAILRLHISKNKRNLGTLTAFGYRNREITWMYLRITATILSAAFVISYVLVWPVGFFVFNFEWFDSLSVVEFRQLPLWISIPLFMLLPLVIVSLRIRQQLKATPGDLVYDR